MNVEYLFSYHRFVLYALAAFFSFAIRVEADTNVARPNIVLIYADDMGYGDLAIQNPESKIPTPNLDRLASEGIRFTDGHSASAVCTLSRYALLTGEYHWRRVDRNADFPRPSVIAQDQFTLAEMLAKAGYRTACIGKWHLGWGWKDIQRSGDPISANMKDQTYQPGDFDWSKPIPNGPTAHGFDYYFGDDIPNRPPYAWIENDRVLGEPDTELLGHPTLPAEGRWETERGPMIRDWDFAAVMPRLTKEAIHWISEQRDSNRPFFLYFALTLPHAPIVPASDCVGMSDAGGYGDFVYQGDQVVGDVLDVLEENGLSDNTLVIFTSDNGPASYAYERVRKYRHRSMGRLRGIKGDVWEGGHRVPLLVRWPGHIAANRVSSELVSQIDLMATLAALIDIELPSGAAQDSMSFLPLLLDESEESTSRDSLVYNTVPNQYGIRHGGWVFIDARTGSANEVPNWYTQLNHYPMNRYSTVLNNLGTDLGQHENLVQRFPERASQLKELLRSIRAGASDSDN